MKYIIEHMDPKLWPWSIIEYRHISSFVGKENLIITNVKEKDIEKIADICEAHTETTDELELDRVCILDPAAEKTLEPGDVAKFGYLVFGGILGNDPPEARTKDLQVGGAERRNLGTEQFSTDNAVAVAKEIISGKKLSELKFTHDLTIELDEGEEMILPFKYLVVEGKPFVSSELVEFIKKKKGF
jgi:ribosome biogenesis SPOUT family RNA methylase Rps3